MIKIKNIAIIAHVDHGKTTLVDKILYHCQIFRDIQEKKDLILDNNDLEKERGITIVSKNVSVRYKDYKINIIDTPGHSDFGGEVERVLNMSDGVLLLVDAFEGPMPQTKYVLEKALQLGKKPILVINKIDKDNCRPDEVHEDVFDLMFNLNANEDQLNFPTVYGSAKNGWMSLDWKNPTKNIEPLLDCVLQNIPDPKIESGSLQLQITSIDHSVFLGRIAIGKIKRGILKPNQHVALIKRDGSIKKATIKEIFTFEGLKKVKSDVIETGDICAITGIDNFEIGDTIADTFNPEKMVNITIDEPTISMIFTVNNSPFFGKESKFITSRHIKERLIKETEKNLALKVHETESPDSFSVFGRGIMHLSILIETMRREGYEFQVGQPRVLIKEIDGKKYEPFENLTIISPESCCGKIIKIVNQRKGEMISMETKGNVIHLVFSIPSRGIMGLRTSILNLSAGEAIMTHQFKDYAPMKKDIQKRLNGSLISHETGTCISYALNNLQDRGRFFITPGEDVYEGMIVGENSRNQDITVNVIRTKKLTNMRASGSDDKMKIAPPIKMSLEEHLEYIQGDEYVEITPKSIRLRKIFLKEVDRKRNNKN